MIEREKMFLDKIERYLKSNGWDVFREVVPDACLNWDQPYRVDMIIFKPERGYYGIEGKHINSVRQGGVIGKGVIQILTKYKKQTYFGGQKIDRWGLLFPINTISSDELDYKIFLMGFLHQFKISLFEWKEYPKKPEWNRLTINPGQIGSESF